MTVSGAPGARHYLDEAIHCVELAIEEREEGGTTDVPLFEVILANTYATIAVFTLLEARHVD